MERKAWVFGFTLLLALGAASAFARAKSTTLPAYLDARQGGFAPAHIVGPDEQVRQDAFRNANPVGNQSARADLRRDVAYGDSMIIGYSYYDYQHNGSIGKMIAKDSQGGIHFVWMKGFGADAAGNRHAVYNYLQDDGTLIYRPEEADIIDNGTRSGYTCLAILPADQRALTFYHVVGPPDHARDYTGTALGVDFDRGFGAFSNFYPNQWAGVNLIWPHGAVSRNNIVHILSTESPVAGGGQNWQRIGYWSGTPNRTYESWQFNDPAINVDTAGTISANVAASVTSDKVVMAWFHNRIGTNQRGEWANQGGAWQRNNDIRYIVSEDGQDFDFRNDVKSLTKILPTRPELAEFDMNEAYGDTFRPYCDIDIQFDPWGDDHLFATFAAGGFFEKPDPDSGVSGITGEHDILWFWNQEQDTITMIYDGYYFNRTNNSGSWASRDGAWRMNADRGSIAFNPDQQGTIYVVWVNFPKIQELNPNFDQNDPNSEPFNYFYPAQDTGQAGYKAAEVMVSISTDYGITWREPINVTGTIWEGEAAPEPGDSRSEAWQSVAYLADDTLHIAYLQDLDPGGVIQTPAEGTATNNPFVYQRIPINSLPLNDPVALHDTGPNGPFMFHNWVDFRPQIDVESQFRSPAEVTPNDAVAVTAQILGGGPAHITHAYVEYQVNNGDTVRVEMDPLANDGYAGIIPQQDNGSVVYYRIYAENDSGFSAIGPTNWWWGYTVRPEGELRIRDIQFRPDTWGTDYSMYSGYEVSISGIVTTSSAFAGVYGAYAIQDTSARWSGVWVRGIDQNLSIGDHITVVGTVTEQDPNDPAKWEYETYVRARTVDVVSHGADVINPISVANFEALTFNGGSESLEGCRVKVRYAVIDTLNGADPDTISYWPITDGESKGYFTTIGLSEAAIRAAGIRNYRQGTQISTIQGVFCENFGHYAIALRNRDDLAVEQDGVPSPYTFGLNPAFPNPFNPTTTVSFSLVRAGYAKLGLYDIAGRLVADVAAGQFAAGTNSLTIDASELGTGVYMLKLESAGRSASQKLVLMK